MKLDNDKGSKVTSQIFQKNLNFFYKQFFYQKMRFFRLFSKATLTILLIFGQNVEDQQKETACQNCFLFCRYLWSNSDFRWSSYVSITMRTWLISYVSPCFIEPTKSWYKTNFEQAWASLTPSICGVNLSVALAGATKHKVNFLIFNVRSHSFIPWNWAWNFQNAS